ncbi:exodeoxyribonuclease V subunit alpha [Luteimonas sp. e5]
MKVAGSHHRLAAPVPLHGEEATPLAIAIARWVVAHGGGTELARTAAQAALADQRGDSALRIEDAGLRRQLAREALVGERLDGAEPFVLDDELFYLRRNLRRELAVAGQLRDRIAAGKPVGNDPGSNPDSLFAQPDDPALSGQRAALAKVAGQRLFVLTGAPGSGKTTTVLRMLMLLARRHADVHGEAPRIALAAPTGKAAQRLRESLQEGPMAAFDPAWHPALEMVREQAAQAGTVHRLLGLRGNDPAPRHHAGEPLRTDLLVIDEASMLDLGLLHAVLAALPPQAPLVLVGDADQLDSVGTGSVLQDIVEALGDDVAQLQRLTHSFRADRALLPLNEAVRRGDGKGLHAAIADAGEMIERHALERHAELEGVLEAWIADLKDEIRSEGLDRAVQDDAHAVLAARLDVLRRRQLLCALRRGPRGADEVSALIDRRLAREFGAFAGSAPGHRGWYPGRRVMISRNDAASGLFNGDIGLCLIDAQGRMRVCFEGEGGQPRVFELGSLPPHVPSFALTVHKAQGSEYDHVAILLPAQAEHPLLSRQWFYTAISRARRRLSIWGSDAAIAHALANRSRRISGLADRIRAPDPG